ncbi:MAG: hypothetical protein NT124_02585 [Candidatus Dependentiae bacterium]|nr:hypothetical protein [Candidatus Dependentiae bacterium]
MDNGSQQVSSSMFDTIKDSLKVDDAIAKVKDSKELLLWAAIYGGIGFISGFFFRQYNRYLIALLLFIGVLVGLQYMGVLTIVVNQEKLSSFFGVQSAVANDQFFMIFFEWIKANVFIAIAFAIGFLLGIRVG